MGTLRRTADWLRQARGEMKAARDLNSTGNYAWCCFACHQAAEKALKAALENLLSPRVGHDLSDLARELKGKVEAPEDIMEACSRLNKMYIPTRYPNAFVSGAPVDKFTSREASKALEDARLVLKFAEELAGAA